MYPQRVTYSSKGLIADIKITWLEPFCEFELILTALFADPINPTPGHFTTTLSQMRPKIPVAYWKSPSDVHKQPL